ncbi:MAG: type II secretion system F family protein [Candidatus Anstonellaceae archaeon]
MRKMLKDEAYESIGRIFGKQLIDKIESFLKEGGFEISALKATGVAIVVSFLLTIAFFFLLSTNIQIKAMNYRFLFFLVKPLILLDQIYYYIFSFLMSFLLGFGLIFGIGYFAVKFSADERKQKIEEVLPDFLVLASANARAGMTIDQALWNAAKPEFGLLSKEVQIVAKKSFAGEPFEDAIDYLTKRINSKIIRRTVSLIKQGLASGSEIAVILEKTAQDARSMQIVKKDIASSLIIYMIFIAFAAAIGTPFLYGVSLKMVSLMEEVFSTLPTSNNSTSGFASSFIKPSPPILNSGEFSIFVLFMILLTSLNGSILIGIITKGNKTDGLKYFPLLSLIALVLYFLILYLMDTFIVGVGAMR